MPKAIKKIKKAIQINPKDTDNWVVWGLIMRTVGNYVSARQKFIKALKIDKDNDTAKIELEIVEKIIELDHKIPLEAVPSLKRKPAKDSEGATTGTCARSCSNSGCTIW